MTQAVYTTVYIDNKSYIDPFVRSKREDFLRRQMHPDADEISLVWEPRDNGDWKGTLMSRRRTDLPTSDLLRRYGKDNKLMFEAANEIEKLRETLGELMVQANELYTELASDADLMRQLSETHPVKEAMRSFERTYLGRTEG
jgi:hypothetical protein